MSKKKSSVDWYRIESQKLIVKALRNEITKGEWSLLEDKLGEQAKTMHKEETIKLYTDYEDYLDEAFNYQNGGQAKIKTFREFYNETFE